jgi:peroxiredoxin
MNCIHVNRPLRFLGLALLVAVFLGAAGCSIEKTEPLRTGSAFVTLTDLDGAPLTGARIKVDGAETPRVTPAVISGIPVGRHEIRVLKPFYLDTAMAVDILLNDVVNVALQTDMAFEGSLDLAGAPTGTVLLINNVPVGTVPTSVETPTLFSALGLGRFRVSAYLPGSATELPAQWTVQLSSGEPTVLSPVFSPATVGVEVGDLAPPFELQCDWDTTRYRTQDYRGQVQLITFFFYNCTACIEEMPYISELYNDPRYAGKVQFIGIDFSDSYSVFSKFRDDHPALDIRFPLLFDESQSVKAAYGVTNCPANFIVDGTGRVRLAQGPISEPVLRQTIDQALDLANRSTYSFSMRDTLLPYTDRETTHEFHGTLRNLIDAPRTFVFTISPVSYPDSGRHHNLCTFRTCYADYAGEYVKTEAYSAMQVDTAVGVILTRYADIVRGDTVATVPVPFNGDYLLDFTVHPADNAGERTTVRLHLKDVEALLARQKSTDSELSTSIIQPIH